MGQNATETLSEIEASRQRLQNDLDVLQQRLPEGDDLIQQAKVVGGAAAAAGVGLIVLYAVTKRSLAERRRHKDAVRQADALAEVLGERQILAEHEIRERPVVEIEPRSNGTSTAALLAALAALAMTVVQFLSRRRA